MKKLLLLSVCATGVVLALGLFSPGNARADDGGWVRQLNHFGPSNFDQGFGLGNNTDPSPNPVIQGALNNLEAELPLMESVLAFLNPSPFEAGERVVLENLISQIEKSIAELQAILSESA